MRFLLLSCFVLLTPFPVLAWGSAASDAKPPAKEDVEVLPASLLQISETEAFSRFVFLVDKEKRKLSVFERNGEKIKKVEEYPADIGKLDGNKMKRDDHRTPEGIYFLEKRLSQPEIPFSLYGSMAFTTNYPNLFDQRLRKTGSGIWLHAVPDTIDLNRGSRGCVVVRDEVIKKLADYVKLRETPILIFDQVTYVTKEEHEKRRAELNSFIEDWRQSWEKQDIETYMSFYDKDFKAPGFGFDSWKAHKASLKSKYAFIKVFLSQPYIVQHNEQLLIKTLQRYESDKHVDYGVKTIYALKSGDSYKIIREEWSPFSQKDVAAAIARDNSMSAINKQTQ